MHYSRILHKRTAGTCRLFLRISGTVYMLSRLDRPRAAVLEGWRLTKRDGTQYDCCRTEHGYSCDCPDYAWRRDGVEPDGCKHTRALVRVGLLGPAPQITPCH